MTASGEAVGSGPVTDSEPEDEETIVVTRQEEEFDPEAEAEFEREYAKMMAESLESRKFERKPLFDVPLPMRRKDREVSSSMEAPVEDSAPATPSNTMAFSLLTKRGNRQQVYLRIPFSMLGIKLTALRLEPSNCLPTRILQLL